MSQDSHPFRWHYGELDDNNFHLHGHNLLFLLLLLLLFLLLLLLLCFFFRRKLFHRSASPSASAASCEGMEEAAVKRLPVRVRQGEAAVCSICLSVLVEGEKERVLPGCSHGFHPICVDEWLRKRSSCPLCRGKVAGEEAKTPTPLSAAVVAEV